MIEGRLFGGRFRAERVLKEGQGIATLLGTDPDGRKVVIKALVEGTLSTSADQRLHHEAQILRALKCPNLLSLLDAGREAKASYLVTPFIEGLTLEERLREGPLGAIEAIRMTRGVLVALSEAHAHGVLHRDVKPANVMIDSARPLTTAVLIDFGLARSTRLDPSLRDLVAGTARYMSPEQAGLVARGFDQRSDLYSVGAMLFESLAGRPLFDGGSVGEVLRQHLTAPVPELRSLSVRLPHVLDDIVQRLLRKEPRDRYQSAEGVLADLTLLEERLAAGDADPMLTVGARDKRPVLTEPSFVGRRKELALLDNQLDELCSGRGGTVFVEAESGCGKTRLLEELSTRAAAKDLWVFRGQAEDLVANRPLHVLDGVARYLAGAARSDAAFLRSLREHLGDDLPAVVDALPALADVLEVAPRADAEAAPENGEARTLLALVALLSALAAGERPTLLVLDDVQWADHMTLRVVEHWHRERASRGNRACALGIVLSFRSDEVGAQHPLRKMIPEALVALQPFGLTEVAQLLESMAGPIPPEAVEAVGRLSEGNPFLAMAVLQGLVEGGGMTVGPQGWVVDAEALRTVQSSRRAAAFLLNLVDGLPPGGRKLLSVGALLGKEFDLDLAASLASIEGIRPEQVIEEARRRHLVWPDAQGQRVAFVHDKIRDALLAELGEEEQRALHLAAAEKILGGDPQRVFELSYHFESANEIERAFPHAIVAGERAARQFAFEAAAHHYGVALRAKASKEPEIGLRIAEALGDVMLARGLYPLAREHFERARRLAKGHLERARIQTKLGELSMKEGDTLAACDLAVEGLNLLGDRVPRGSFGFVVAILGQAIIQFFHTWFPAAFVRRVRLTGDVLVAEQQAIRIYDNLGVCFFYAYGPLPAMWAHLRVMNRVERYPAGDPIRIFAYSAHAALLAMQAVPAHGRITRYSGLAVKSARACGEPRLLGAALHLQGIGLWGMGKFEEAVDRLVESVRFSERAGDLWHVNTAGFHLSYCLYHLGRFTEAIDVCKRTLQTATEIGDASSAGPVLEIWAKASLGQSPRKGHEWLKRDPVSHYCLYMAEGACLLLADDNPEAAAKSFEKGRQVLRDRGIATIHLSGLTSWLTRARREVLARMSPYAHEPRRALLDLTWKEVHEALGNARKCLIFLPMALREVALVETLLGRITEARKYFDESLEVATRLGQVHERALTLRARGEIGLTLDWPGAAADLKTAETILAKLDLPKAPVALAPDAKALIARAVGRGTEEATLSLADRFLSILDEGRKIASALTKESVYAAVRAASSSLLRGEGSFFLELAAEPAPGESLRLIRRWGKGDDPTRGDIHYSESLVRKALETRRPAVLTEGLEATSSDSQILSGVRSALCAPIRIRRKTTSFLYVVHGQVGGLFGEEEERLASFITALAGAALENAEATRTLEKRVEDRTRALKEANEDFERKLRALAEARD